jgi:phosphocarrier protein HPr
MRNAKFTVVQDHGIHARVAAAIAKVSAALTSKITFKKGGQTADGTSVLQLLMLAAEQGSQIEVVADGGNEEQSMKQLSEFFSDGSGI